MSKEIKLDLGCGRKKEKGWIGIDRVQVVDGNGDKKVDHVLDLENEKLPYEDDSVSEIKADDFLEHLWDLQNVMNESWRVLKKGGTLWGHVPKCGTLAHYKDPTHRRCFVKETFSYFTGKSDWKDKAPSRPKYADYGFYAWDMIDLHEKGDLIYFTMKPQK